MKKNYLLTISICLFIATTSFAQSVNYQWAKSLTGFSADNNGVAIATDVAGNVYITGFFNGTVDFDPSLGNFSLTSVAGSTDIFIEKLTATGNLIWVKQFGGIGDDEPYAINIDAAGNLLTSGYFSNTVDFDPSGSILNFTSNGFGDIYIQKLNSTNGNLIWVKQIGGTADDGAFSVTTDAANNVYATGYFEDTVDFDPSPASTFNYSAGGGNDDDAFTLKLDQNGNFKWATHEGSPTNREAGTTVSIDTRGNVLTTGFFVNPTDFDPSPTATFTLTSAGNSDVFLQLLDSSGNFKWAKSYGGTYFEFGYTVIDRFGNIITAGLFGNTADFNPSPTATYNVTSSGSFDAFVCKLDSNGNFKWANHAGGLLGDAADAIATDSAGNIYTTGYFKSTADFDPSATICNLTTNGTLDIYIQKLDSAGHLKWIKQMGGNIDDTGNGIAVTPNGKVYTTGFFTNTVDFDPGSGVANLTTLGGFQNTYIQQLQPCNSSTASLSSSTCNNFILNGDTFTTSGIYTQILTNYTGCDSFLTLNLTITPASSFSFNHTICSGSFYFFNGNNLTANGNYKDTLTNYLSCDSIVTLHLTVLPVIQTNFNHTICSGSFYFFNGNNLTANGNYNDTLISYMNCDSIVTLHLTVLPIIQTNLTHTICSNDFYFFNGQNLTLANTYHDTLISYLNCDSFINLTLIVKPISSSSFHITICNGSSYFFNGQSQTQAGIYNDTLTNYLGCDSVVSLQLSLQSITTTPISHSICAGDSFLFNGNYLTTANTYADTLSSTLGCDSFIVLTLTVNNLPVINLGNDTLLCIDEKIILTPGLGFSSYLWNDNSTNDNDTIVCIGQNQIKTSVIVTDLNGCTATDSITIQWEVCEGINSVNNLSGVTLFPNPTSSIINLQFADEKNYQLQLFDINGKSLLAENGKWKQHQVVLSKQLPAGTYRLVLSDTTHHQHTFSVIKN